LEPVLLDVEVVQVLVLLDVEVVVVVLV